MAIINTTSLATATQNDINALTSSCSFDAFTLLASTITSNDNISSTVANTSVLPDLSTTCMEGTIIFVTCLGVPVIATNKKWMGLDGRTLRQDCCDNTLWTWGMNNVGQLASGTTTSRCSPAREICCAGNWCNIAAGRYGIHGAAVKTNNTLWTWGCNSYGQLGDGTTSNRCSPVREKCSATNWCFVTAGGRSTAAIKTDGSLWTWGRGNSGGLGDGTTTDRCSPVREASSSTNWTKVTGFNHMLALKADGSLWAWGTNSNGRLGDGTTTNRCSPVREFCSATNWCHVSAGYRHNMAVKTNGTLWGWGYNNQGQLGQGSTSAARCCPLQEGCSATDWCGGAAGTCHHTVGIKTDGSIWSWGYNFAGALATGGTTSSTLPVREICSATNWCKVGAGCQNAAAIKTDGSLWGWGLNCCGFIGNGNATNVCSPVREICSATDWSDLSVGDRAVFGIRRL